MKLINVFLFFVVIKCSFCKTSLITYPMVDLFENSPLNTFVISLNLSLNVNETRKLLILNLNGFESKFFSIKNGNICTIELIDREEFVKKKYCLDQFYCKIEIHILVNDGFAYWIIPIHIIDENDNKPEFRENEIELKFRENIPNGYKIPFEGARDLDEGQNGAIDYILDCSNDLNKIKRLNESSRNCFPLFQLLILSQSSSTFDQLALRFVPSLSVNIENEYQLKLYAIDTDENENSINLNIKIEGKERAPKFSLLKYEFFILINSSLELNKSLNKIGRVYAIPNDLFQRISYKLIKTNETNDIEINSLTGELNFILNQNKTKLNDQIQFDVQASTLSSNKLLISKAKVKVSFRYLNLLNNISFQFQFDKNQNQISQLNNSNSFFINQNIQINQNLFQIFVISFYYPFDKYILSLNNYLNTFSLISSSSLNNYFLKTHQHLTSTSIYLLNIGIKHKLSQQFLPNLTIELILIDDQWTTTTEKQILITRNEMPTIPMITSTHFKVNKLSEFCLENKSYILYNINKKKNKKNEINLLKVIKSNSILINNKMNLFISKSENKNEIIINKCRMSFNELNNSLLNKSLEYQLCSSFSTKECYNLTFEDENKVKFLVKPIEIIMFLISIIFVIITIILILLICRLKHFNICLKLKRNLFSKSNYGLNNVQQQLSSSSSKSKQRVHSIVIHESRSPSFQSIRIKNDPYVFNLDDLLQREPLPSSNMFILPPIGQSLSSYSFGQEENNDNLILTPPPPRTSSSSSFLQETKQLLEMISTNQNLDLSKLVSEV